MLSVIVPVFNEEAAIRETCESLHRILSHADLDFELLVVNDGSTDHTADILRTLRIPSLRVVEHGVNRGNGAAIKKGLREASGETICTVDADGTYPLEQLPRLYRVLCDTKADMVLGKRAAISFPLHHRFAKFLLRMWMRVLTGSALPDINSGMRMMPRVLALRYANGAPNRFSLHIAFTMQLLLERRSAVLVPIEYYARIGNSKLTGGLRGVGYFFLFLWQMAGVRLRRYSPRALPRISGEVVAGS